MEHRNTTRNTVSRNTKSKTTTLRSVSSKSVPKTTNNRTTKNRSANISNKRRISSSKSNIKRPIPKKTKSPKINRNVTRQAMKPKQMDYAIFFTVLMLVMFGIVMIFSSSYFRAITWGDKYRLFRQQLMWAGIGFLAMMFMTFYDYRKIKKYSIIAYIGVNILLVLVLFMGDEANGSIRSIFGFQPSEVAKIVIIIFISYIIDKNPKIVTTWKGFFTCMVLIAIPTILIGLKNLSTAIVVEGIGCIILFVSGTHLLFFAPMVIPAGIVTAAFILIKEFQYRLDRVKIWLDPWSDPLHAGFQIIQSLYAVASGGLFGRGLGNSIQKLGYIPEAYNDIIFAIVCEELGLVGAGALILLFIILISRGIIVALKAKDLFASLVATGITSMVAIQAIINISVVTNTIPTTGMALPFISYGGSSLFILMISMGILLNISCYRKY